MPAAAPSPPTTPSTSPGPSARGLHPPRAAKRAGLQPEPEPDALHQAASRGDADAVQRLLEAGEAVEAEDDDGWTALVCAASSGQQAVVRMLLAEGASTLPLFRLGPLAMAGRSGGTPLHFRQLLGEEEIVTMLLAATHPSGVGEAACTYGRVLLLLRALQDRGGEKALAARLAAAPEPPPRAPPRYVKAQGAWSFSYSQFIKDAGPPVVNGLLQPTMAPAPPSRSARDEGAAPPAPRPPAALKPAPPQTAADWSRWYSSVDGRVSELEGKLQATQMPEVPPGTEWNSGPIEDLLVSRAHSDLQVESADGAAIVKRTKESLWSQSNTAKQQPPTLAAAVFAPEMSAGRHYIECRIQQSPNRGCLLGVALSEFDPATSFASVWAYDILHGSLFHRELEHEWAGAEPAAQGDCIGLHLDSDRGLLTVFKNGRKLGVMSDTLSGRKLRWVMAMWDAGDQLHIAPLEQPSFAEQPLPLDDDGSRPADTGEKIGKAQSGFGDSGHFVHLLEYDTQQAAPAPQPAESPAEAPAEPAQEKTFKALPPFRTPPAGPVSDDKKTDAAKSVFPELVSPEQTAEADPDQTSPSVGPDEAQAGETAAARSPEAPLDPRAVQRAAEYQLSKLKREANFQLSEFLKISETGEVTLLVPRLADVCRNILRAMTVRQLLNLAKRRFVSVLDCTSLTKAELQQLVVSTAAIDPKELYVDLADSTKEFRQRLHHHHTSPVVTRPQLMSFLKELGAEPSSYYDKGKLIEKITEHWAGRELKKIMLSDKSKPLGRTGAEQRSDPAALHLSRTQWIAKLEGALGWIAPGSLFVSTSTASATDADLRIGDTQTTRSQIEAKPTAQAEAVEPAVAPEATVAQPKQPPATSRAAPAPATPKRQGILSGAAVVASSKSAMDQAIASVASSPDGPAPHAPSASETELLTKVKDLEAEVERLKRHSEDVRVRMEQMEPEPVVQVPSLGIVYNEKKKKPAKPIVKNLNGERKLREAAAKNQSSEVRRLCDDGIDPDAVDADGDDQFNRFGLQGFTALHHAVSADNGPSLEAATVLLLAGCKTDKPDAAGILPRGYAVDPRAAALLDLIDGRLDDDGESEHDLQTSTGAPAKSEQEALMERRDARLQRWPEVCREAESRHAVLQAAAAGEVAALDAALGTDPQESGLLDCEDGMGQTPMSWAAHRGHKAVVQRLLTLGADPSKGGSSPTSAGGAKRGNFCSPWGTPFFVACRNGHHEIASILTETEFSIPRAVLDAAVKDMEGRESQAIAQRQKEEKEWKAAAQKRKAARIAADRQANLYKYDAFCVFAPPLASAEAEEAEAERVAEGMRGIRQLLNALRADAGEDTLGPKPASARRRRTPRAKASPSRGARKVKRRATPRQRRKASPPALSPTPPATARPARDHAGEDKVLAGLGVRAPAPASARVDRPSPPATDARRAKQVARGAAKRAAAGGMAVMGYGDASSWGTGGPKTTFEADPSAAALSSSEEVRFTSSHRELRVSEDGKLVSKKRGTKYGEWRTAVCADRSMVMRQGGGGVSEVNCIEFELRGPTKSETESAALLGDGPLSADRALPRQVVVGVALKDLDATAIQRGTSTNKGWGLCVSSGKGRHAGKTFDWPNSEKGPSDLGAAAGPGDKYKLALNLPEGQSGGGGAITVFHTCARTGRERALGQLCRVPAGEFVWMVEAGDPGECVRIN